MPTRTKTAEILSSAHPNRNPNELDKLVKIQIQPSRPFVVTKKQRQLVPVHVRVKNSNFVTIHASEYDLCYSLLNALESAMGRKCKGRLISNDRVLEGYRMIAEYGIGKEASLEFDGTIITETTKQPMVEAINESPTTNEVSNEVRDLDAFDSELMVLLESRFKSNANEVFAKVQELLNKHSN